MEKYLKQYEIFLKKAKTDYNSAKILFDEYNNNAEIEDAGKYLVLLEQFILFAESVLKN